jgi:hypothetical protein
MEKLCNMCWVKRGKARLKCIFSVHLEIAGEFKV